MIPAQIHVGRRGETGIPWIRRNTIAPTWSTNRSKALGLGKVLVTMLDDAKRLISRREGKYLHLSHMNAGTAALSVDKDGNLISNIVMVKQGHVDFDDAADIEAEPDPHRGPEGHRHDGPDADDVEPGVQRRLHIMLSDLQTYGFSADCPRCDFLRNGQRLKARSYDHTEACRARIYKAMRDAKNPRIARADAEGSHRTQSKDVAQNEPNLQHDIPSSSGERPGESK